MCLDVLVLYEHTSEHEWQYSRSVPPPYITTAGLYASKYYYSARAQTLVKTILQLSPDALPSPANTRHTRPGSIGESGFGKCCNYNLSFLRGEEVGYMLQVGCGLFWLAGV